MYGRKLIVDKKSITADATQIASALIKHKMHIISLNNSCDDKNLIIAFINRLSNVKARFHGIQLQERNLCNGELVALGELLACTLKINLLDISNCKVDQQSLSDFTASLKKRKRKLKIDFSGCDLDEAAIKEIVPLFGFFDTLRLDRVKIGDVGLSIILQGLSACKNHITTLHLSSCGISGKGFLALANHFEKAPCSPITKLFINNLYEKDGSKKNICDDECIKSLARIVSSKNNLASIGMIRLVQESKHLAILAEALLNNTTICSLTLHMDDLRTAILSKTKFSSHLLAVLKKNILVDICNSDGCFKLREDANVSNGDRLKEIRDQLTINRERRDNLFFAISKGDVKTVEAILDKGEYHIYHVTDKSNDTALHLVVSATENQCELLGLLLSRGFAKVINQRCGSKKGSDTPLHRAIRKNNIECVKQLLDQAGIINDMSDASGMTPLDCVRSRYNRDTENHQKWFSIAQELNPGEHRKGLLPADLFIFKYKPSTSSHASGVGNSHELSRREKLQKLDEALENKITPSFKKFVSEKQKDNYKFLAYPHDKNLMIQVLYKKEDGISARFCAEEYKEKLCKYSDDLKLIIKEVSQNKNEILVTLEGYDVKKVFGSLMNNLVLEPHPKLIAPTPRSNCL